jgi:hypothetical protein
VQDMPSGLLPELDGITLGLDLCTIPIAAVEALQEVERRTAVAVTSLQGLSLDISELEQWAHACTTASNYFSQQSNNGFEFGDVLEQMLANVASGDSEIITTGYFSVRVAAVSFGEGHLTKADPMQGRRRLLARAAAKSSTASGGITAAVKSSDVSDLGWTTDDWNITSKPIRGRVLPLRSLGRGNVILGGILLHQVHCCYVLHTARVT